MLSEKLIICYEIIFKVNLLINVNNLMLLISLYKILNIDRWPKFKKSNLRSTYDLLY